MTDPKAWLAIAFIALAAVIFYQRWKMQGNKMKLREMLMRGAAVIDVRNPHEYAGRHLEGAVNIPLPELKHKLDLLGDKDHPIVVYCSSGMRSGAARRLLLKAGFSHVENGLNQANLQNLRGVE